MEQFMKYEHEHVPSCAVKHCPTRPLLYLIRFVNLFSEPCQWHDDSVLIFELLNRLFEAVFYTQKHTQTTKITLESGKVTSTALTSLNGEPKL